MSNIASTLFLLLLFSIRLGAQDIQWATDGSGFFSLEKGQVFKTTLPGMEKTVAVSSARLTPAGQSQALTISAFKYSDDLQKVLVFTNTRRAWRYETRGDYWVLDIKTGGLTQLGKGLAPASLMFAKFSPDAGAVAYVSERNLYWEDLASGKISALSSTGGLPKTINGTFDWAYEEEFDCRDGFRWSPDGAQIAYWQIDANRIRDFALINNTDSIYSFAVPVAYPKVGEAPSSARIGVVRLKTGRTEWMKIPETSGQVYLPRMEWMPGGRHLMVQGLNRKQNETMLWQCDPETGRSTPVYTEKDDAWIDLQANGRYGYWDWAADGQSFLWTSEKDGWRHVYRLAADGKTSVLLTPGNYDVIRVLHFDPNNNLLYFSASPENATQEYLFRVKADGKSRPERVSPASQPGTHSYLISPDGRFARHTFSNYYTPRAVEWLQLPEHKPLPGQTPVASNPAPPADHPLVFFQVTTADGVTMDGWLRKPARFDPSKKYPVVFYVYTEPWGSTVKDAYGIAGNNLYDGDMAADGYIYASLDNRGTPVPKGRAWRKAIYRKIGQINIRDQAMGAQAMFGRWSWIDTSRVAVHGWSGGGSATLNLLFQYPDVYKTGIAVAAVANQLTYDNIYQERYMGLPQENMEDFIAGSPLTHARNLRGNLLYIHGTGDDNVHYQNAELLIDELVRHNRQFQIMPYPNRTHGISEREGTRKHLSTLFTRFLKEKCPPGGR